MTLDEILDVILGRGGEEPPQLFGYIIVMARENERSVNGIAVVTTSYHRASMLVADALDQAFPAGDGWVPAEMELIPPQPPENAAFVRAVLQLMSAAMATKIGADGLQMVDMLEEAEAGE